ncbi:bifunctional proline dehydrogenase/L-glutamate gamma-semialdehyde dehydrogenase PutA [Pseudomonas syringae]|uniref:bifunctional proline dehydrogenase/L-glutamate gamma-semialdehyde dehydrogenase PutA n=1 Tax=Pseudomonas syringae TaxID=317 RepID=UPI000E3192E1|nr:bifunctional proline dehydrogenase/L-glutamate gamma-semialdehyde dehydrogenase PutA [Pseudomonas syringae]
MATTTLGVKLDDPTRERLKAAAHSIDRTPHWLIKQAIFNYLEKLESGATLLELDGAAGKDNEDRGELAEEAGLQCFLDFAESIQPQSVLRAAITSAYRRPEPEVVPMLLEQARLSAPVAEATNKMAASIAEKLRNQKSAGGRAGIVQGLLQEFSLSSQEGVALMCLAEALLRIPDKGTRDALIRDKISNGNWQPHLGNSPSLFVNAATWGLLLTGRLVATHNEAGLTSSLSRIIGKSGEPMIRKGVDMAMRLMGEQFVTGETIGEALANASRFEAKGFRYSYDMLGEAALTEHDAQKYLASYEQAIHSIGKASHGRGIYEGPGISIKLSALHPRYSRAQYERVMDELYPRLLSLTLLAKQYDIGLNIDAEEADRLELSLDLLERLCFEPQLTGWNGIGFVIQAYQKRCPYVIDYVIDLARRSRHRLMIRLVKGAYWDSEIKRAQVEGLEGYPVYTRKVYTDVSYIACARKLLAAPEVIYPQFATHNAHTLAAIYQIAGQNYYPGQYEFQCLHGMGEPLYEQVVGKVADGKLNRPCRVYAPVGTHETLLAYLVRRLLENGANTSFVNRIADHSISIQELVADPVSQIERMATQEGGFGLPHPRIPLPRDLYGTERANSSGIDMANEHRLASLSSALLATAHNDWKAAPMLGCPASAGTLSAALNPSDLRDVVGHVQEASLQDVDNAIQCALSAGPIWQATPPVERAAILERAADLMEAEIQPLMGLLVREAGKTFANAIAEVREAVDFLRYYAVQARNDFTNDGHRPLGPVVCISPWNFPLAIFSGQVAAALAAGNPVLAKPAEQTPLGISVLIELIGDLLPPGVLNIVQGYGREAGEALASSKRIAKIAFTGSTPVGSHIMKLAADNIIPSTVELGGKSPNIFFEDIMSAEPEFIDKAAEGLVLAFFNQGEVCTCPSRALVQESIYPQFMEAVLRKVEKIKRGDPLDTDTMVGAQASEQQFDKILSYLDIAKGEGAELLTGGKVEKLEGNLSTGYYIQPTLLKGNNKMRVFQEEIFGPVVSVTTFKDEAEAVAIANDTEFGLGAGLWTRDINRAYRVGRAIKAGRVWTNCYHLYPAHAAFGGYKKSGVGRETHKIALEHYQQTKNLLVSYDTNPLGFF